MRTGDPSREHSTLSLSKQFLHSRDHPVVRRGVGRVAATPRPRSTPPGHAVTAERLSRAVVGLVGPQQVIEFRPVSPRVRCIGFGSWELVPASHGRREQYQATIPDEDVVPDPPHLQGLEQRCLSTCHGPVGGRPCQDGRPALPHAEHQIPHNRGGSGNRWEMDF